MLLYTVRLLPHAESQVMKLSLRPFFTRPQSVLQLQSQTPCRPFQTSLISPDHHVLQVPGPRVHPRQAVLHHQCRQP